MSVMQFPSTWCPLTATAGALLQVWAAALLQHQHYNWKEGQGSWGWGRVGCWFASPCVNLVIDLSGHLHWLFIICSQPTSQQGGHMSG